MKKTFYLISVLTFAIVTNAFGQKPTIELTFTAQYQTQYVLLDSIYIENLTQGGDTILYAPDTVLVLDYTVGVAANPALTAESFRVSQNRPNPFTEQTIISIFLPEADRLQVSVINLLGQKVAFFERSLDAGSHSFVFYPGDDKYYILSATANGLTKTIKMVSLDNHSSKQVSLNYRGADETQAEYKSSQDISDFGYSLGDQLRFIGYTKTPALINGSDIIEDAPLGNQTYTFEIIEGIPCPGTPTVTYEGQTYNTVQIGDQCWFKENLNVGTMIPGIQEMTDNSIIEKYCYDNDLANCSTYGGLYQWNEMMQYITTPGMQGICPEGWHLPTDTEWTTLTDFLGGEAIAGGKMKATGTIEAGTGLWYDPNTGATNQSGFTTFPGGHRDYDGGGDHLGSYALFWSSTEFGTSNAWFRGLGYNNTYVWRQDFSKTFGYSVRCVKDQEQACPGTPTVTYEGQTYNTVQIGTQCWFKENLNVGTMIPGSQEMVDNGIIEKYCYDDDPANCATYGSLYQWSEMMQYDTVQGTQGICPTGWHIPTDAEWTVLTDFLGGEYIAGGKMKATGTIEAGTGLWYAPNEGATNSSGFTALPAGYRHYSGNFFSLGFNTLFWSSTEYDSSNAWDRLLLFDFANVNRDDVSKGSGFSSRCVKDQEQACPGTPTVIDIDGNVYNTVQIDDQCWMKENLKTTTYSNGTAIPNVTDANAWINLNNRSLCLV